MVNFRVVLVTPRHEGNVGAVVRSMGNFDFHELFMVAPCEIGDEAFKRAKHAGEILRSAVTVQSLDEAIKDCDLIVGTSGIVSSGEKHFVRIPITPRQFAERVKDHDGTVALLFGPEDSGLAQEDLLRCDLLVNIPSSADYPVLNLSHAVTIVLYELFMQPPKKGGPRAASQEERKMLFEFFDDLLGAIDYPEFRKQKTKVMFRRMMGRAIPTKWEFHTIMGVFGDAAKKIRKKESKER
jgi:TrmH family RNA methyltransferase